MKNFLLLMICTFVSTISFGGTNWSIEKPVEKIPNTPLSGEIFGKKVSSVTVKVTKNTLTIKSIEKSGHWPESELTIFVKIDGSKKEWLITPSTDGMVPHIHMNFAKKGKDFRGTLMYVSEYSMKLVLTEITDSKVKGLIHISLPDYRKSYLVGAFEADRNKNG